MKRRLFLSLLFATWLSLTDAPAQVNTNNIANANTGDTVTKEDKKSWDSPEIILAVITTFTTVLTTALAVWQYVEARKQKNEAIKAKATVQALESRLFYKAAAIIWRVEILDFEGSLEATCTWEDIEIIPPGATLANVPGALTFAPVECTFTQPPTRREYSFKGEGEFHREVRLIPRREHNNSYKYNLEIVGSLPQSHKLTYTYDVRVSKGVFMNKEEVTQKAPETFKKEFWGHYVATPIERIDICIRFPEGYQVKAFAAVCIGKEPSDRWMQTTELARINKPEGGSFKQDGTWAQLKVNKPFVGFSYLIYWEPLPKAIVDALKKPEVSLSGG